MIPGSGRSPGEGNGNPLQYSCLENPMDRGAWWATVHEITKRVRHHWATSIFTFFRVVGVILIKTLRFLRGWREKDTNPEARLTNGRGAGRRRIQRTRSVRVTTASPRLSAGTASPSQTNMETCKLEAKPQKLEGVLRGATSAEGVWASRFSVKSHQMMPHVPSTSKPTDTPGCARIGSH